jgi:hypothetical protein
VTGALVHRWSLLPLRGSLLLVRLKDRAGVQQHRVAALCAHDLEHRVDCCLRASGPSGCCRKREDVTECPSFVVAVRTSALLPIGTPLLREPGVRAGLQLLPRPGCRYRKVGHPDSLWVSETVHRRHCRRGGLELARFAQRQRAQSGPFGAPAGRSGFGCIHRGTQWSHVACHRRHKLREDLPYAPT